jgi:hypothetical protein
LRSTPEEGLYALGFLLQESLYWETFNLEIPLVLTVSSALVSRVVNLLLLSFVCLDLVSFYVEPKLVLRIGLMGFNATVVTKGTEFNAANDLVFCHTAFCSLDVIYYLLKQGI